jgi:integrase
VSLDEGTVDAIPAHRARQNAERLACGEWWQDSGLVFTTENGLPPRPSVASSHFQRLVRRTSGLTRIRLHDLRHTSASLGLEAGESLKEVFARLGHSTISVTADTYAHISPELARESAERLAGLVAGHRTLDGR